MNNRRIFSGATPVVAALALAASLVMWGCDEGPSLLKGMKKKKTTDPTPGVLDETEIRAVVDDGQRMPLEYLVQMTKPERAKTTRTPDEAAEALASPELEPLREALTAGGWTPEQQAQMVFFAGTHQSGAPEDSIRHRQEQLHESLKDELEHFRRELAAAEVKQKQRVDQDGMFKAGIVTRIDVEVEQ